MRDSSYKVLTIPKIKLARHIRNTTGVNEVVPSKLHKLTDDALMSAVEDILGRTYGTDTIRTVQDKRLKLMFTQVCTCVELHPNFTLRDAYVLKLKNSLQFWNFEIEFPDWKDILPR